MIGAQVTKAYLDNQASNIAISLRQDMYRINALLDGVGTWGVTELQGIGYSAEDAAKMLTALMALKKVRDLGYGLDTQPTPIDLRPYLSVLTGID